MYQPIITADPDQILLHRRFGDREDRVVILRTRVVGCKGLGAGLLLGLVVAAQVRTDDGPTLAAIDGLEQHFAAEVEDAGIMRRQQHGRGPPEAVQQTGRGVCARPEPRRDVSYFTGVAVVASEVAVVIAGVNDLRIAGIGPVITRLAAADRVPLPLPDRSGIAARQDRHAPAVLLRSVDAIVEFTVGSDMVELPRG